MKIYHISQKEHVVTAAMIVMFNDKVLILKRGGTAPWMPNMWNLPGGGVEEGESVQHAAERECQEEAGISPSILGEVAVYNDKDFELHIFKGLASSDSVSLNFESSDYKWVDKSNYNDYHYVPYIQKALSVVLNQSMINNEDNNNEDL